MVNERRDFILAMSEKKIIINQKKINHKFHQQVIIVFCSLIYSSPGLLLKTRRKEAAALRFDTLDFHY